MSYIEHKAKAPKSVRCAVITISDTRTKETDESGKIIINNLEKEGHRVLQYIIVPDEKEKVREAVGEAWKEVDAIITNGGTGLSSRDITIEAIAPFLEKKLEGFGELFRRLSYEEIGPPAMLSRALAGTYQGRIIICLPGSSKAAELAMERLVLPELPHMVLEANK